MLNTGNGPDPLVGRGVPAPQRGWVLAVDVDERLSAWRVNAKLAATLPGRPPRENKWPNIALVRDASADPPLGVAFASNGESVVVATQAGKLTRYSADRLHFRQEADAKEVAAQCIGSDRRATLQRRPRHGSDRARCENAGKDRRNRARVADRRDAVAICGSPGWFPLLDGHRQVARRRYEDQARHRAGRRAQDRDGQEAHAVRVFGGRQGRRRALGRRNHGGVESEAHGQRASSGGTENAFAGFDERAVASRPTGASRSSAVATDD